MSNEIMEDCGIMCLLAEAEKRDDEERGME
jgi:hypothetical protein